MENLMIRLINFDYKLNVITVQDSARFCLAAL